MVLADTSVWIDHLRAPNQKLTQALLNGHVLIHIHPFISGELACRNLRNRNTILRTLNELPLAAVATDTEVLQLIESRKLDGRATGWIDAHLLASARLSQAPLFTLDKRLHRAASDLGLI